MDSTDMNFQVKGDVSIKGTDSINKLAENVEKSANAFAKVDSKISDVKSSLITLSNTWAPSLRNFLQALPSIENELNSIAVKIDKMKKFDGLESFKSFSQKLAGVEKEIDAITTKIDKTKGFSLVGDVKSLSPSNAELKSNYSTWSDQSAKRIVEEIVRAVDNRRLQASNHAAGMYKNVPALYQNSGFTMVNGLRDLSPSAGELKSDFFSDRAARRIVEAIEKAVDNRRLQTSNRAAGLYNNVPAVYQNHGFTMVGNLRNASPSVQELKETFEMDKRVNSFIQELRQKYDHPEIYKSRFAEEYERQSSRQLAIGYNNPLLLGYNGPQTNAQSLSASALITMGQEKANYQKAFLGAYIKAEQEQGTLDNAITAAKKEEAEAAKRSAETAKKAAGLTADQAEKYKQQQNRTDAYNKRTDAESAKFDKYIADKEKGRQFKLDHPEFFLSGGYLRDPRYQFGKAFEGIGAKVSTFGVGSDKLEGKAIGGVISAIGTIMKSPIAGGVAALMGFANGILEVGKAATQAYAEIESIRTQLGVVFSSQTQADSMFGELSQYATKSPFGVQQTSELAILLKQSGVYASDLMDTLKMIGDTAGGNMEKMKRIANNYAQIVSIGKASMLDMRQFAYAGIPIFEAVSKELGVSQQELRKLISDGKVTSDIIEKVFKDLTGINGIFENATEKGAKTLKARLQNLADAKQLAMGAVGELGVNLGTQTGGDSYALNIVTGLENIYSWLREKVNTVNIENSVKTIENRNSKIDELKRLIDYLEGKKTRTAEENLLLEGLKKRYAAEFAKRDIDMERAKYKEQYDIKTDKWRNFLENQSGYVGKNFSIGFLEKSVFGTTDESTIADTLRTRQRTASFAVGKRRNEIDKSLGLSDRRGVNLDVELRKHEDYNALLLQYDELTDAIESFKDSRTITAEDKQAKAESETLDAQRLITEATDKAANATDSLNKTLLEIGTLYKNSPEKKEEEENKHLETLLSAQKTMQEVGKYLDSHGVLDFMKIPMDEFLKYMNKGGFTTERRLTVVEDKSDEQMKKDRQLVHDQIYKSMDYVYKDLAKNDYYEEFTSFISEMSDDFERLNKATSDLNFFKEVPIYIDKWIKKIHELGEEEGLDEDYIKKLSSALAYSMATWAMPNEGAYFNLNQQKKGKELPEYVELWKRIAANATGWDAALIKGSGSQFISDYSKQASRNVVTGGVQGLVSAGTMSGDILSRMRYEDSVNKQGVRQIDWRKTEHDMIKDALSLRDGVKVSASALSGLSKALGDQLSVYEKLTVDMVGVGEDWSTINTSLKDGFKNNPHLNAGNFLDNAFQASVKSVGGYSLAYDNELGLVVKNASGTFKRSVDELKDQLKKNQNAFSGDLKTFVQSIGRDTIIKALDDLRKSTMALNDTIGLATSVTKQAADWDKQASQTWGKALGGSSGSIVALLNANTKATFDYFQKMTSVDLKNRPQVPWEKMEAAGWGKGEGTATVYSSTYSNRKDFGIEDGEEIAINVTPILPDGTVLSPGELDDWVYNLFKSEDFNSEIVLGVYKGKGALEKADSEAWKLHKNQAELFGLENPIDSLSSEVKQYLSGFISTFAGSLLSIDTKNWNNKAIKEYAKEHGGGEDFSDVQLDNIREAVKEFQDAPESFEKLQKVFEAMGKPVAELADSAERLAKADKAAKTLQAADDVLNNTPLSFSDSQDATKSIKNLGVTPDQIGIIDLLRNSRINGNTFQQQLLLSERGYEDESFKDFSKRMTDQAIFKKEKRLTEKYKVAGNDFIADMLGDDAHGQLFQNAFSEAINTGDFEEARNIIKLLGGDFDALTESINQAALTSGSLGERFINLGKQLGGLMKDFAGSALTSTFETLGKSVGESADSSKALRENFRQLGSGLMQNMGTMITQAGLAMIIGAGRDKKMIYAGLALAAAGVGASFLSGLLSADKSEDDKDDGEMQKLLNLKNDLADLLKQAREDAVYYENTVRHKNAISANEAFKTTKVNDAIITPSGNVISTHPDDYLIATKTPQTLVGSGAPTINFSVIDKSTGIQVTKQTSVYNRNDNSIDFEAVIESKVQEIIATSKGDDAFAARQARLDGRRVIA